jgi:spore coat protein CotF
MIEMTEQEILQDALIAHKFLLSMYNQFGLECSNPTLRNLFIEQYADESKNDFLIFEVMKKEGFYPVTEAPAQKVEQAIKMHTQMQTDLDTKLEE